MIHDYTKVLPLLRSANLTVNLECAFREGQRNSIDSARPNLWDTPPGEEWSRIVASVFEAHTENTYNRNMRWLFIIKEKGWDFSVEYYKATDVKV
jgi:hypothetical protein